MAAMRWDPPRPYISKRAPSAVGTHGGAIATAWTLRAG